MVYSRPETVNPKLVLRKARLDSNVYRKNNLKLNPTRYKVVSVEREAFLFILTDILNYFYVRNIPH